MCTLEHFDARTARLESLGFDRDLAEECAYSIGDTPCSIEGHIWVTGDAGAVIAVIPEHWLFGGRRTRRREAPDVILMRGCVDQRAEHIALCSSRRILVRLAPKDPAREEAGLYLLEWLVPPKHRKADQWADEIISQISMMFMAKEEEHPWGYLLYHCGTASNFYNSQNGGVYFARMPGTRPTGNEKAACQ